MLMLSADEEQFPNNHALAVGSLRSKEGAYPYLFVCKEAA